MTYANNYETRREVVVRNSCYNNNNNIISFCVNRAQPIYKKSTANTLV